MPMVNPSPAYPRLVLFVLALLNMATPAALAQPADYIDLGDRTGGGVLVIPVRLAHPAAVQWYRIELPATGPVDERGGFVDLWVMAPFDGEFMRDGRFALFDDAGSRLWVGRNVSDFASVSELSFGSTDPRPPIPVPPSPWEPPEVPNPPFSGQNGPFAAGVYWVSIANRATYGAGPWEVGSNANPSHSELETVFTLHIRPMEIPYCNADFNWDGNVDQDDVLYLANVLAGGENPTGRWADYNRDGNEDQDDLLALVHTIAGGGCPE
ncbi:MAG: hypothetical protein WAZ94_11030 [Phycisphaerales bacterium]